MQRSTHQELMKPMQDAFHKVVTQFKAVNFCCITIFYNLCCNFVLKLITTL